MADYALLLPVEVPAGIGCPQKAVVELSWWTASTGAPTVRPPARSATPSVTLHSGVFEKMGRAIATGDVPPGTVFTLDRIETHFEVSRTVAREAVRVLESMNLVSGRRRVGITVQPTSFWNVFDPQLIRWRLSGSGRREQLRSLTVLRSAIEPPASAAAAAMATAEQRRRLVQLSEEMTRTGEAGDLDTFLGQDIEFHRLVLAGSGNEMFAALSDVVAEVLAGRTEHRLMPTRPRPEALAGHRAVARAIAEGRMAEAETEMRAVVAEVADVLARP